MCNKIIFLNVIFGFFLLTIITGCDQAGPARYSVEKHLTPEEQEAFLYSISRYIGELPKRASNETKFDARFDEHYRVFASRYKLNLYHSSESGEVFFLVTRIAPSITEKYVALGGKFQPNETDPLNGYEEVFRTWKMPMAELEPKMVMLFDKMVKGQDLSSYYTMNSGNMDYIEFPDAETSYNKELRIWESTREDVLAPYMKARTMAPVDTMRKTPVDTLTQSE